VSEEYREAFGSHAYDAEGNYIGSIEYGEFTPETEAQAAWAEYATEIAPKASEEPDEIDAEVAEAQAATATEAPSDAPEAATPSDEA
jgi:hypothetical protein